jgi:hypothetical protein
MKMPPWRSGCTHVNGAPAFEMAFIAPPSMSQEQLPDVAQCDLCDKDGWVIGDLEEDGYAIARRLRQRRHARQRCGRASRTTATRRSSTPMRGRIAISTS